MNGDTVMPLDYAALRKRLCELETMPGDDDWYEKVCELLAEALRKAADAGDADLPFRQWFRKGIMMLSRDPDLNESNAFMVWRYKSKSFSGRNMAIEISLHEGFSGYKRRCSC